MDRPLYKYQHLYTQPCGLEEKEWHLKTFCYISVQKMLIKLLNIIISLYALVSDKPVFFASHYILRGETILKH